MKGTEKKESMTISWARGVQLDVNIRKHHLVTDQPVQEGGTDGGITPVEMFVASLGTCIGYFAVRFCQRHKLRTEGLRVEVDWDYAERPHRIGSIKAHLEVPGEWDPPIKDRLKKVIEGCTIHQSISMPPEIVIELSTVI